MTDEAERRILRLCSSWGEWYSRVLLDMAIVHGWQKPVEPEGFRTHEYNGFKFTWRGPFRYDEKADDGGGFYYFPTAHGRRLGGR